MRHITDVKDIQLHDTAVALGKFDGFHRGHQLLIHQLMKWQEQGMTGVIFTNVNALRICLYKYDWLEVNPGISLEQRKNVPWEDLIAKDRKTLGPRTLKGFIFPWKE